jgi:hypothetical protein
MLSLQYERSHKNWRDFPVKSEKVLRQLLTMEERRRRIIAELFLHNYSLKLLAASP